MIFNLPQIFPLIYLVYTFFFLYQVYTWYIPGIYRSYDINGHTPGIYLVYTQDILLSGVSRCSTRCGRLPCSGDSATAHMAKGLLIHSGTLGIISRQPCPRARPRRHAARRARGEIFRLLLDFEIYSESFENSPAKDNGHYF